MSTQTVYLMKWDSLGGILSFLCLIHCLALPLMATLLPIATLMDESVHVGLFAALAPTAALAAWTGYWQHRQRFPCLLMITGLMLVGVAALLPMQSGLETALTTAGGLLLITAHIANGRLLLIRRLESQHP
jgi:hypothetical protein